MIQVVLADDHPLIRSGIRTILDAADDIILIAEAADGYEAQQLCHDLKPHVLLLDLSMPGPAPNEVVAHVRTHCPDVRVLALTALSDEGTARSLVISGVAGYVLKDEDTDALLRAIRAVAHGDCWFSPSIMDTLVRMQATEEPQPSKLSLTKREQQLLSLVARGWDNKQIAHELNLAEQTVRNYISRIYVTLGVRSRAETIVWARERGLAGI